MGRLICRAAGFQQGVGLFIREAAVVQTALCADKRPDVPVSGQAALTIVQVEAPVPQALEIRLPRHGVHDHGQAAATEGVGDLLCGGHLEGVLLVDQQGHLRTGVFPGAIRGGVLRGGISLRCKLLECKSAVCALQRGGIPVTGRGDGELGGAAVTQQAGVHQTLPVDGLADRLPQCPVVEGRTAGVEAQKLHDGGGGIGVVTAAGYAGSAGAGEIQRQQLDLPGGKGIEHGVPVLTVL